MRATERPYNSNIHPFKWRGFWDMQDMEARGLPEVKAMLKRAYRKGWEPKLG